MESRGGSGRGSMSGRGVPVRHNLPHVASLSQVPARVALSKSAAKKSGSALEEAFPNLMSMEELEMMDQPKTKVPPPVTPTKSPVPGSLPTPPSDGAPSDTKKTPPDASKANKASPPTPIKLKICRSLEPDGASGLTSSVQLEGVTFLPDVQKAATPTSSAGPRKRGRPRKSDTSPVKRGRSRKSDTLPVKRGRPRKSDTPAETITSHEEPEAGQLDASSPGASRSPTVTPHSRKRREQKAKTKAALKKKLVEAVKESKEVASSKPVESKEAIAEKYALPPGREPKWMVGDLIWAKVGGHPWWPCMVSYDPLLGIYVRLMSGPRNTVQYHMQFFGEVAERGWVAESSTIAFEGLEPFQEYCADMIKRHKKDKARYQIMCKGNKKLAWDIAVQSAEVALPMSRNERRQNYTFIYDPPKEEKKTDKDIAALAVSNGAPAKRKYTKRKHKSVSEENDTEVEEPPKKRRKRKSDDEEGAEHELTDPEVAQYLVFCQKRRDLIRREHPSYDERMIEKCLQEQWGELEEEQRSKFIPMGCNVQGSKPSASQATEGATGRSIRVVKPSKKKLEADFDNEVFFTKRKKPPKPLSPELLAAINSPRFGTPEYCKTEGSSSDTDSSKGSKKGRKKKSLLLNDEPMSTDDEGSTQGSCDGSVKGHKAARPITIALEQKLEFEISRLNSAARGKNESVCLLCEEGGDLVTCQGLCFGTFHADCLGVKNIPEGTFKCDECLTGVHTCFVCRQADKTTMRCSVNGCGHFYHVDCVKKYPHARVDNSHIYCPMHVCLTCAIDNPKAVSARANKGRLYRCVRCPKAFHQGDFCISAGSKHLAGYNVVCSDHFQPIKNQSHHTHVNVNWCFLCSLGGTLLCCESCPAAFHAECLKIPFPEGSWNCKECIEGERPHYGDVVWVKLGSYRWWPGEICHPRHVPDNIQDKPHEVGEFPIHFFGSHDYYWTHRARVFLFQEGDKGSKESASAKGLAKVFKNAVTEATLGFQTYLKVKASLEQQVQEKNDKKPPPYKQIKNNIPVGSVIVYKADLSEIPRCNCNPEFYAPCSAEAECLNRMLMYECHPNSCPAGEACQNQRFQRRQYPELEVYKTEKSGWGLRCKQDLRKHDFVCEYVGDLIDAEECRQRIKQAHKDNVTNFYMLTIDKNRVIDAGPRGNVSRFMNHSCQPNCDTQKWNVNGDMRVGLFAACDIPADTELTFNYNLDCLGNEKKVCYCGAENCSGFLGVRPKNQIVEVDRPKLKKKKKRKLKVDARKEHEDDCYRCGDGGELIMCDKTKCPKAYHVNCLGLTKPPHGKWVCPWHHCDVCGKLATKLCNECPNSFCANDISGNIFDIGDGKLVCSDHDDILNAVKATMPGPDAVLKEPSNPERPSALFESSSSCASSVSDSPTVSDTESLNQDLEGKVLHPTLLNVLQRKVAIGAREASKSDSESSVSSHSSRRRSRSSSGRNTPNSDDSQGIKKSPKKSRKSNNNNVVTNSQTNTPSNGTVAGMKERPRRTSVELKSASASNKTAGNVSPPLFDDSTDDDDVPSLVIDI